VNGSRAPHAIALVFLCWAATATSAVAQLYQPLPARYGITTDVRDAGATWVNPAALALSREASVGADITLDRTTGTLRLAQTGLVLQSSNIGFGWSRSRYPGGPAASVYALAVGLGDDALSLGLARRWFRGGRSTGSWDLALRAKTTPSTDVSLVWRLIGSPVVRDTVLRRWPAGVIPGAGVRLLGGHVYAAGEAELKTDLSAIRELRAAVTAALFSGFTVAVRGDLSPGFAKRGFAVVLTWRPSGGRVSLASVLPSNARSIDAVGALGAIVAIPRTSRFGR